MSLLAQWECDQTNTGFFLKTIGPSRRQPAEMFYWAMQSSRLRYSRTVLEEEPDTFWWMARDNCEGWGANDRGGKALLTREFRITTATIQTCTLLDSLTFRFSSDQNSQNNVYMDLQSVLNMSVPRTLLSIEESTVSKSGINLSSLNHKLYDAGQASA